jgi:glutamine---fructose-6-phosphate transaminase (isomerizing)
MLTCQEVTRGRNNATKQCGSRGEIDARSSGRIGTFARSMPTRMGIALTDASTHTSRMREAMAAQPQALRDLLGDRSAVEAVAERLDGRRVLLVGTGTSWHAAAQGAHLLRLAGLDASAAESADVAVDGPVPQAGQVLLALSHTGAKRYTAVAVQRAREAGAEVVQVCGVDVAGADLVTVSRERSSAYTISHLAALMRLAQLARVLGAPLDGLDEVPDAVERALDAKRDSVPVPERLIEFIGGGVNQWTAAEGALKIREAAYVASEGLAVEQFLHGPSVALRASDHLVCLDGGGDWSERVQEIGDAAGRSGVPVTRIVECDLAEPLSVFALTVAVQRIALESAEALGTDPDSFGRDVPGRESWDAITL